MSAVEEAPIGGDDDFASIEAQMMGFEAPADGPAQAEEPEPQQTEPEATDEPETPEVEDEPKPKKKPVSERIAELTRERREAERRADEAERRLQELEGKKAPEAPAEVAKDDGPNPDDYDLGDMDPAFIRDLSRYEARKEFEALKAKDAEETAAKSAQAEVQQLQSAYQERVVAASEKYADFDEVVTLGAMENQWPCPEVIGLGIMASEVGPDVAYHLATNKAEAVRIANLHPLEQAREFGRLEAKFLNPPPAPQPRLSSAPPPPDTRPRGTSGRFSVAGDTDDLDAFETQFFAKK